MESRGSLFFGGAALLVLFTAGLAGFAAYGCAEQGREAHEAEAEEEEDAEAPGPTPDRTRRLLIYAANLNFEAGLGESGKPEMWSGGGEGYERSLDRTGPHSGNYAAQLKWGGRRQARDRDVGMWTQCIAPDYFRGKRVRYFGWLRTEGVSGRGAALWIRVDGEGEKRLSFDDMGGREVRGTTGWERYEVVVDVPAEAKGICFGWLLAGAGTAWADDLKFRIVDAATPLTGRAGR